MPCYPINNIGNGGEGLALDIQELRRMERNSGDLRPGTKKKLARHKTIDVVVGIPFYNEKRRGASGDNSGTGSKPVLKC